MKSQLAIALILLTCSCRYAGESSVVASTKTPYRSISLNTNATVSVLNALANDVSTNCTDRAIAVFTLFANNIKVGDSAVEVHRVLTDTRWLEEAIIRRFCGILAGAMPVEVNLEDTVFDLWLFANEKGCGGWNIEFRLSGHWQEKDALAFLRGETVSGNPKIAEFALSHYTVAVSR